MRGLCTRKGKAGVCTYTCIQVVHDLQKRSWCMCVCMCKYSMKYIARRKVGVCVCIGTACFIQMELPQYV